MAGNSVSLSVGQSGILERVPDEDREARAVCLQFPVTSPFWVSGSQACAEESEGSEGRF